MQLNIPRVVRNWEFAHCVTPATEGFAPNGFGRRSASQPAADHWCDAFKAFGLIPDAIEPMYQNFTGNHYLDGAHTHTHTDSAPKGMEHVRCNVMVKKPPVGGNPVFDGEEVVVNEGDLWLCLASLEAHASTPIKGGQRTIFSFGALVPSEQIKRILL